MSSPTVLNSLLVRQDNEAKLKRAIGERFEFTKRTTDQIRRTAVYEVVAEVQQVTPHRQGLRQMTMRLCVSMGALLVAPRNTRLFARMRHRDEDLIPGKGRTAAQARRAWFARLYDEGLNEETAAGRMRELPRYREYRRDINGAFFEQAVADYWKQRRELDIWGLYALEGLSIVEVAKRTGEDRNAVYRIVTARRRAMGLETSDPGMERSNAPDVDDRDDP